MAETRLLASAWPEPASGNAVPWSTEVRTMGRPSVMFTQSPKPANLMTGNPWS